MTLPVSEVVKYYHSQSIFVLLCTLLALLTTTKKSRRETRMAITKETVSYKRGDLADVIVA